MKINLFLDLEETLIKDWFDRTLIPEKIKIIKAFVKKHKIKEATMFSMAIWGGKDVIEFDSNIKPWLEETLEIKINTLDLRDIFVKILKANNIHISNDAFTDIFVFNSKRDSFLEFLRISNKKGSFLLFDDTVEDSVIFEKDMHIVFKKI